LFSEIYLDGNQFGCQGAYDLIKLLLIDCEKMLSDKRDKLRMENELKAQEGLILILTKLIEICFVSLSVALLREQQGLPAEPLAEEKKEEKKKKKSRILILKKKQLDKVNFFYRKEEEETDA